MNETLFGGGIISDKFGVVWGWMRQGNDGVKLLKGLDCSLAVQGEVRCAFGILECVGCYACSLDNNIHFL